MEDATRILHAVQAIAIRQPLSSIQTASLFQFDMASVLMAGGIMPCRGGPLPFCP